MSRSLVDWCAELSAAGKGGYDDSGNLFVLRQNRETGLTLTVPLPADYTGATMRGQVRNWPDSAESDDPLATLTCTNGGYSGGYTTFTVSLSAALVGALPAAAERAGHIDFAFDLLITPSGGSEELLLGGILRVIGRATQ